MLSLIGQNWTHFLWALIATIMMVIIGFLTPLLLSEIVTAYWAASRSQCRISS